MVTALSWSSTGSAEAMELMFSGGGVPLTRD